MLKLPLPDFSLREWFTSDLKKVDWPRTVLLVLLILAVFSALWQYAMPQVRTITTTEFRRVTQIKEAVKIKRVLVPCPEAGIVALDKAEVAKKLDMPWLQGGDIEAARKAEGEVTTPSAEGTPPVAGNPADLQVTATADLPQSVAGYQLVTLFDTQSGVTTPVVKEKPLPWLRFENNWFAGLRYGINQRLEPTITGYAGWEFLRIKKLVLSGYGEVSAPGDAKIQTDLQYRR